MISQKIFKCLPCTRDLVKREIKMKSVRVLMSCMLLKINRRREEAGSVWEEEN